MLQAIQGCLENRGKIVYTGAMVYDSIFYSNSPSCRVNFRFTAYVWANLKTTAHFYLPFTARIFTANKNITRYRLPLEMHRRLHSPLFAANRRYYHLLPDIYHLNLEIS